MFSPNCVIALMAPEIALKSPVVRSKMTGRLRDNVFLYLKHHHAPFSKVSLEFGRFFIETTDCAAVIAALKDCFGLHAFAIAQKLSTASLAEIQQHVKDIARGQLMDTFAVRGKSHSTKFSSKELEQELGGTVLELMPELTVRLKNPATELYCLAFDSNAYVYFNEIEGPEGMPVGSQGKVALVVSSEKGFELARSLLKTGCALTLSGVMDARINSFSVPQVIQTVSQQALRESIAKHKFDAVFCDATTINDAKKVSDELGVKVFCPLII